MVAARQELTALGIETDTVCNLGQTGTPGIPTVVAQRPPAGTKIPLTAGLQSLLTMEHLPDRSREHNDVGRSAARGAAPDGTRVR